MPVDHNDKKLCKLLKFQLGTKKKQQRPKGIRKYTILTTTGCNARCAYCFEKGIKPVHMTLETADKTAQFIINHRGEHQKVQIDWFGGEPLVNFKVMDLICTRLIEYGVNYFSRIATNGYLFNEIMTEKDVQLWHLKRAQITIDGTEQNYNRIKAFTQSDGPSPFKRVLNNIGMLLNAGIKITVRLHVSNDNVPDIRKLIELIAEKFKNFKNTELLTLQFRHLFELFGPKARLLSSEERETLIHRIQQLIKYGYQLGISSSNKSSVQFFKCMVESEDAIMIVPDGHLGLCEHHSEDFFFGHIDSGEWDWDVIRQSREYCEEIPECETCALYPRCYRLKICGTLDICFKEVRENEFQAI